MDRKYNLKLDLQFRCNNQKMHFGIHDNFTSDFFIRVTSGGRLVDLEKAIVMLVAIKPDHTAEAQFLEIKDNNIYADLNSSMKNQVGTYKAKALLISNNERVETNIIEYEVEDDGVINQLNREISQDTRFELLDDMLSRLSTIESNENARIEAESRRVDNEILREKAIEEIKLNISNLIEEANRKVQANLEENSKKVDNLISSTKEDINNYKLEKDEELNEDFKKYKENANLSIADDLADYKKEADRDLESYKTSTTQDINTYKNSKDAEIDRYVSNKSKELDEYKKSKDLEIDDYKSDKNSEIDNYKNLKNSEIDTYKSNKDTLIDNKIQEVEAAKQNMISTSNNKIQELNTTKNELTNTVNNKVAEADGRISELQSFESQLQQIETVNTNQNTRLDKVEYVNKRQDVMINGLFNENADGRLSIEGEGNDVKLEGSKDGLVEVESVKGNTLVNLWNGKEDYSSSCSTYCKTNTTYTIILDLTGTITNGQINIGYENGGDAVIVANGVTNGRYIGTITTDDSASYLRVYRTLSDSGFSFKVIILEGDYTNKPIPQEYFEGMKSTFEDCQVMQEMVDSGEEEEENLGKYRVDYKVTGKNKFDTNILVEGSIDDNGIELPLTNRCRSNYIHMPAGSYTLTYSTREWCAVLGYDKKYNFVKILSNKPDTKHDFVVTSDIYFIRFKFDYNIATAKADNIQLEEGTVATPYEPYKESTATVYLDEPLYKDNELCVHDGKLGYWKNWDKIVLDGSEDAWTLMKDNGSNIIFRLHNDLVANAYRNSPCISNLFVEDTITSGLIKLDNSMRITDYSNKQRLFLVPTKDRCSDLLSFKQWLSNNLVTVVYQLAEPYFVPILEDTPKWILESFNSCSVHFETNVPISSSRFTYTGNVPSVYGMEKSILDIEDHNVDMVATTFDMDYRLLEVEWALEDAGITGINLASTFNLNNRKGEKTMALSRYEQAKIMILGGAYDKDTLTRQLSRYLEKKLITQSEYDELISLMEAKELVTGE